MSKQQVRSQLRTRRREISSDRRHSASKRAACLVDQLPDWRKSHFVAAYLAMPEEFDCGPLLNAAWHCGKQIYLPGITQENTLQFLRYSADDALRTDRYGIHQPLHSAARANIARLDVMFLPLVGWDQEGTRLGMGAGYYDRALASARPGVLVGLGYDCQESDALPREPWDVPLDYVLTESRLIRCARV
ncbi:MAG: 5-formyltetrahydrofolate cyclo-ligase [Chromatocurvus sp.]